MLGQYHASMMPIIGQTSWPFALPSTLTGWQSNSPVDIKAYSGKSRSASKICQLSCSGAAQPLAGAEGKRPANASGGFVAMHGVGVCAGPYSPALVTAWKAWDVTHSSENGSVADLPHDQVHKARFRQDILGVSVIHTQKFCHL